jgi:hypothetical protein
MKSFSTRPHLAPLSFHPNNDEQMVYRGHLRYEVLREGKIPPVLREAQRLVMHGDSANGDRLVAYVQRVLRRLSDANDPTPAPDLAIFLSDTQAPTAGALTHGERPMLFLSLGLLDAMARDGLGEDHLAALLAVFRSHLRAHATWKDVSPQNAALRLAADAFSVLELDKAGYAPGAAAHFFDWLHENGQRETGLLGEFDAVWSSNIDRGDADVTLANLQLKADLDRPLTPLPTTFQADLDATRFVPEIEKEMAARIAREATELSREAREGGAIEVAPGAAVGFLGAYLTNLISSYMDEPPLAFARYCEAVHLGERLAAKYKGDPQAVEAATTGALKLARRGIGGRGMMNFRQKSTAFPGALNCLLTFRRPVEETGDDRWKPARDFAPDEMLGPKRAGKAFLDAATPEARLAAARRFEAAQKAAAPYARGIEILDIAPPRVDYPSRYRLRAALDKGKTVVWPLQNLFQDLEQGVWADDDRALVVRVAIALGAQDPRLDGNKERRYHYNEYTFGDLTLDAEGRVTALALSDEEKEEVERKRQLAERKSVTMATHILKDEERLAERVAREKEQLAGVDWDAMEKDFDAFLKKHADALIPEYTLLATTEAPFAAAFMTRLEALRAADPAHWEDVYQRFLSGARRPSVEDEDELPTWMRGEDKPQKYSLPDLMARGFKAAPGTDVVQPRGALPDGHAMAVRLAEAVPAEREEKEPELEQVVFIRRGVPIDHPFAQALIAQRGRGLDREKGRKLIELFRTTNPATRDEATFFELSFFRALGLRQPKTTAQFTALLPLFREREEWGEPKSCTEVLALALLNHLRAVQAAATPEAFQIALVPASIINLAFEGFAHEPTRRRLRDELNERIEAQIAINSAHDLSPETSLDVLLDRYRVNRGAMTDSEDNKETVTERNNLFWKRSALERAYEEALRARIEALPENERSLYAEKLLALPQRNPAFRGWLTETWANALGARYGLDSGDEAFAARLIGDIDRAVDRFEPANLTSSLLKLLDRVEAQREVSFAARDKLKRRLGKSFLDADLGVRMISGLVEMANGVKGLRRALLDYLSEPATEASVETLAALVHENSYGYYDFVNAFLRGGDGRWITEAQMRDLMSHVHRNFWAMPFEMRTLCLNKLLYVREDAISSSISDPSDVMVDPVAYTYDRRLPNELPFAPEAREGLDVYAGVCPEQLRRLTYPALLAGGDGSDEASSRRLGRVLSQALTPHGAAGGVLLQRTHNYLMGLDLASDEMRQFRDDLAGSKTNFAPPLRWEIFERLDDVLPLESRATIAHVGEVEGSGSTAFVVRLIRASGAVSALKVMRQNVKSTADVQLGRFRATFEELAKRHDRYRDFPAMVDQARDMLAVATDGRLGAVQVAYADATYGSTRVSINGRTADVRVARVLDAGAEYLETEQADGLNFNDFVRDPVVSADEKIFYAAVLQAYEWDRLLSGLACCEDRHGGQSRLQPGAKGGATLIDFGAVPCDARTGEVRLPTDAQKEALGRVLGQVLSDVLAEKADVTSAFLDAVRAAPIRNKDYLVGVQMSLLAHADHLAALGATEAKKRAAQSAILRGVLASGRCDPRILKGLVGSVSKEAFWKLVEGDLLAATGTAPFVVSLTHNAPRSSAALTMATQMAVTLTRRFGPRALPALQKNLKHTFG